MHSWDNGTSFYANLINDTKIIKKLSVDKLKKLFDFSYHTKRINVIFKRSLKK
jgi:adenylosuccinate lyase